MMVRLRDFAEIHRITERTVQIHIKNNEDVLEGHVERRGKQGTWLDEFAVDFLLERIQLPTKDEVLVPTPREASLLVQLADANRKLADAERKAGDNAEAAGKVLFLEASNKAQEAQIRDLTIEVGKLTQKVETAAREAAEDAKEEAKREKKILEGFIADAKAEISVLSDERDKAKEMARLDKEAAQRAQDELAAAEQRELEAEKAHREELAKKEQRIQELESRTLGDYLKGLFRKKGKEESWRVK